MRTSRARLPRWSAMVLALLGIASAPAAGQTPLNDAAIKLAGASSLVWRFDRIDTYLGTEAKCTGNGETDRFFADHKLQISKCIGGTLAQSDHTWSLSQRGPLDIVLTIDAQEYLLLFHDAGAAHFMRLRQQGVSRTDPTTDRDFRLSDD